LTSVTRGGRFGLYTVYQEFQAIRSAEVSQYAVANSSEYDAAWHLIVFFQFLLEYSMLCLCVLLDKKLHGGNIGRKFFLAEPSSGARKRE
jgi:hypothetical protein